MKVIVAGSRDSQAYTLMEKVLDQFLEDNNIEEVVSGGAPGIDRFGEVWATVNKIPVKQFRPDWKTHKLAAGPIRNRQMAEYGDALIAFWDGESKGTKNMIEEAQKRKLLVKVIKTND